LHDGTLTTADDHIPSGIDAEEGIVGDLKGQRDPAYLQIQNPSFDYVPPALISLFVTGKHGREVCSLVAIFMYDIITFVSTFRVQIKGTDLCLATCTGSCMNGITRLIGERREKALRSNFVIGKYT
jgi:hypothetical protein